MAIGHECARRTVYIHRTIPSTRSVVCYLIQQISCTVEMYRHVRRYMGVWRNATVMSPTDAWSDGQLTVKLRDKCWVGGERFGTQGLLHTCTQGSLAHEKLASMSTSDVYERVTFDAH